MVSEELTREFFHTRDERLIRKLSEISQVISYKRGEELYAIGEPYTHFFILIQGLTYTYFCDEQSRSITNCFFSRKYDFLNIEAYDKKASVGMKALMDTEVYAVPIQAALTAVKELPGLAWEYANYLQKSMVYLCVVNNRRMYFSSNQRYQWFCEKWPQALSLASNRQIATFLRIRPESLSRLKSQLKQCDSGNEALANILVTKDLQWDYMDIKQIMEKKENAEY